MNGFKQLLIFAGIALFGTGSVLAQNVQHLNTPFPGGMPANPVLTQKLLSSNSLTVTWDGPAGYYTLYQQPTNTSKAVVVTTKNLTRKAVISPKYTNSTFSLTGPAPLYAGAQACVACHKTISNNAAHTAHRDAFNGEFAAAGGQNNPSCLPCHTVGYGAPGGFVNATNTPGLAGVQCESCHGPAAKHAANPANAIYKPRAEIASTVCGGCHTALYNEWTNSAHAVIKNINTTTQISACGRCHSGSVRLSLIKGKKLPTGDANMGIECATCHDSHPTNGLPAQVRNPLYSTNDYFLSTSDVFAKKYNQKVNLCAQCHNHRGDSYTNTTYPPHLSAQYNILLGTVGELASGLPHYQPSTHALSITNQCVGCHMSPETITVAPNTTISAHSHSFEVKSTALCTPCHGKFSTNLINFARSSMLDNIQTIKFELDYWATNNAPAALRTKYGTRAWEYTNPGALSSGGSGPTTAEQALIPKNIKKARFNLYLVLNDGSSGIHNPEYCVDLLMAADEFIRQEVFQ